MVKTILQKGDPALTKVCHPVVNFDTKLHTLLDDMKDTLIKSGGLGLAAPQIGILRRVVLVMDEDEQYLELVNPEIVSTEGEQEGLEGCLSLAGMYGLVTRPMKVKMQDIDWDGDTAIICICNGRHYGGGFMPVPDAMPDDGVLDMLLVPGISLPTFARVIGKYAKGLYKQLPDLIWARRGQEVTFTAEGDNVTVVDGEVVPGREFTVRLSEKKLNFFYPVRANYGVKVNIPAETL